MSGKAKRGGAKNPDGKNPDGVCKFIAWVTRVQVTVKIAHWTTPKYSRHVALDELHASLQSLGDQFVEAWMGRHGRPSNEAIASIVAHATPSKDIDECVKAAGDHLMTGYPGLEPELSSIRDDMLAAISKAMYLLRLE